MALSDKKITYTKKWTSAADFPTYEGREEKVRADMQLLFDEIAAALNALIDYLSAGVIPFETSEAVPATDVQAAIEYVQSQLAGAVTGQIPDRSLGGVKLELGAVDTTELADGAVTADKIGDRQVTGEKLELEAVDTEQLKDGSVTADKFASGALDGKADLVGAILKRTQRRWRYNSPVLSGSDYPLTADSAESILLFSNSSAITVTLPSNSDAAIEVGASVYCICGGAGVTFQPDTGVTLLALGENSPVSSYAVTKKNTAVLLLKLAANQWIAVVPGVRAGEVGTTDIADDAVTGAKIADDAVDTGQIKNGAVTAAKTTGLQKAIQSASGTLTSAGWSNKKQTLSISGMKATSDFVAAPSNKAGWAAAADAVLYPPTAGVNTLEFECDTVPQSNIAITVYFWEE